MATTALPPALLSRTPWHNFLQRDHTSLASDLSMHQEVAGWASDFPAVHQQMAHWISDFPTPPPTVRWTSDLLVHSLAAHWTSDLRAFSAAVRWASDWRAYPLAVRWNARKYWTPFLFFGLHPDPTGHPWQYSKRFAGDKVQQIA
jgi:hypothetical protein